LIQGASATITKLAMLRCHGHIAAEHPEIKMLLTLHDELQFEVPDRGVNPFGKRLPALCARRQQIPAIRRTPFAAESFADAVAKARACVEAHPLRPAG
jgi:DNA polymerase I-like protein with 3'-5' exonuclease and polymerase domains